MVYVRHHLTIAVLLVLALAGCGGEEEQAEHVPGQAEADSHPQDEQPSGEAVGVWAVTDNATALVLDRRLGGDTTSAAELVAAVNRRYPRPEYPGIALDSVAGRTVYVRVIDDAQLGQRMGTIGSMAYMAAVTFSLTSLPSVDAVYFAFKEGVHARPGRYTRADWRGYFETPDTPDTLTIQAGGPIARRPTSPLRIEGACPFECCTYGTWTTTAPTTVFQQVGDTTTVAFTVPAGTKLEASTGHVLLTEIKAGIAQDSTRLYQGVYDYRLIAPGDTVLFLDYVGEGVYHVWYTGGGLNLNIGRMEEADSFDDILQDLDHQAMIG